MAGFSYNYKPIDYKTAQNQALQQLNPLYQQGVKSLKQQQYSSNLQAGNVAAARGLGHSGLAADQLNKIAIATQGNIANLDAQRMTQANTMAQDLVNQDKQYDLQRRSTLFNEYASNRDYNYGIGRDKVADQQWNKQFNYTKSVDDRDYKYQQSRDKVNDDWRNKEWSQMSPAERQRMALEQQYSMALKKANGGGGGGSRGGRGRKPRGGKSGLNDSQKSNARAFHSGKTTPGEATPTRYHQYESKEYRLNDPVTLYKAQMERINEQRKAAGLPPVNINPRLKGYEY